MNPQIHSEEQLEKLELTETSTTDTHMLMECGFTTDEIVSLLWLRQWYQSGGSDRTSIVRHLEFLKLLVLTGKIEL